MEKSVPLQSSSSWQVFSALAFDGLARIGMHSPARSPATHSACYSPVFTCGPQADACSRRGRQPNGLFEPPACIDSWKSWLMRNPLQTEADYSTYWQFCWRRSSFWPPV
jgi:hypothetical protein